MSPALPGAACQSYAKVRKVQVRTAVVTPDGGGYWVLLADGAVYPEGDAIGLGSWKAPAITDKAGPGGGDRAHRATAGGLGWCCNMASSRPMATLRPWATWPPRSFLSRSLPAPAGRHRLVLATLTRARATSRAGTCPS